MSVLSFCLVRSTSVRSVIRAQFSKGKCTCLGRTKELTSSRSALINQHPVLTVSRRTLIRKRQLIGTSTSSHLKAEHKKDKLGPDFEFIYASSNIQLFVWWTPMIYIVITSVLIICGKIIRDSFMLGKEYENVQTQLHFLDTVNPLQTAYVLTAVMLGGLVVVLGRLGTVLMRMYYNKSTNEFVAVLLKYGLYRKKIYFKASDVVKLDKVQVKGNVKIKGKVLSVSESNFTSTPAYNMFMGYNTSRPSALKEQQDREDITKTLKLIKERMDKQREDKFVEKYKEKRKQRQLKDK